MDADLFSDAEEASKAFATAAVLQLQEMSERLKSYEKDVKQLEIRADEASRGPLLNRLNPTPTLIYSEAGKKRKQRGGRSRPRFGN